MVKKGAVVMVAICLILVMGTVAYVEEDAYEYFKKGVALMEEGEFSDAEEMFAEAVRLDPKHNYYRYAWAITLGENKKYSQAVSELKKVVESLPSLQQAWYYLRIYWLKLGDKDSARKYFLKAVKKHPDRPAVRLNYAYILYEMKEYPEATKQINEALKRRSNFSEAICLLGKIFAEQDNINDAIQQFEKSIQIDPDYAEAYYNLGVLQRKRGELEKSEKNFEIAIRLKPSLEEEIMLVKTGTTRDIILRSAGVVETATLLVIYFPGGVAKVIGEIEETRTKAERTFDEFMKKKLLTGTTVEFRINQEKPIFSFYITPNFYLKFAKVSEGTKDKLKLTIRKIPDVNYRFDPEGVIIEDAEITSGYIRRLSESHEMEVREIILEESKVIVLVKRE